MKCPICNLDLSPLDLVSRTEHVDLCIENGPSVVEVSENGTLVVKKTIPPAKQRKICPVCDKTFQNLQSHYKTCSLKNDVPPSLMLDHWELINRDCKNPKKFPIDLLDNFVKRCIKDGRVGHQVDIARALYLSMSGDADMSQQDDSSLNIEDASNQSAFEGRNENGSSISGLLDRPEQPSSSIPNSISNQQILSNPIPLASTSRASKTTIQAPTKKTKKFNLEAVDEVTKRSYVALRIERELAAARNIRFRDMCLGNEDDQTQSSIRDTITNADIRIHEIDSHKLFYRARMKLCDGSQSCLTASCDNHQLTLLLEEFKCYTGKSMDAEPCSEINANISNEIEQQMNESTEERSQ